MSKTKIMVRLVVLVKPLTGYMISAILLGLLGHLAGTFITVLGAYAVLSAVGALSYSLPVIFAVLGFLGVFRGIFRYGEQLCNHYIAFKLLALIRDRVFAALRKLCPAKLEGRDKGNLIAVITSDVELLEVFYAHTISPAAIAVLFTAVMVAFLSYFHPLLGAFAFVAYFIIGVCFPYVISKLNGLLGVEYRKKSGDLASFVLDNLRGLSQTIQYSQGPKRLEEMNRRTDDLADSERKMKSIGGINFAISSALITLISVLFLFLGIHLWKNGEIPVSSVIIPFVALISSFGPTLALAALGSSLQGTFAAGERVLEILDESPMVEEVRGRIPAEFSDIRVKDVSFAYEGEEVLSDLNLEIPKGKTVGISGKSGSGKSTLLRLLMRFWSVGKGEIRIGDRDIDDINTSDLRDMEGFVTQSTHLFRESIANNIRISKPDATQEEIELACKRASIHDFITRLPRGYETTVGELGDTLSGGERQRIGLARAFLHDAPLLLLDEPTSNLDSLNEAIILHSLHERTDDKTVILVSHRKSTLRVCDNVIAIDSFSNTKG